MTEQEDKVRYERHFETIFSKINKALPINAFALTMTILVAFWGSLFGLIYNDMQNFKQVSSDQRIEVIREIGEVKTLISLIKK